MVGRVPEKPSPDGLEARWDARWEAEGTYRFDRTATRDRVYAIDTPPPTVSGSLHVGHAFSYTQTDIIARYQRMRGREVFYPMGFDDNGLPTERRVQNYFGVRCDPSLPYVPDFEPPAVGGLAKDQQVVAVSRPNFVELCQRLTAEDERAFEDLFRYLGLSVDWTRTYTTIDDASRATSQRAWLRLLAAGEAYQAEAPTLWDIDFRTAVAQAELEDRDRDGAYHQLAFERVMPHAAAAGGADPINTPGDPEPGGPDEPPINTPGDPERGGPDEPPINTPGDPEPTGPDQPPINTPGDPDDEPSASSERNAVLIDTTRPELLAACVALVAHPDDERYQPLFGTTVRTPLFGVEVPVLAHPLAQPDKGTGAAMICTFGDVTDVVWWRELGLPLRAIVGRDGRLLPTPPPGLPEGGAELYRSELAGKTLAAARTRVVELLGEEGSMLGEPRKIRHAVKFYEKGDRPLEIVTSRQWFIRTLEHRKALAERGAELRWHPGFMQSRYQSWVEGLNTDWLVSRQRFFGVPFPLWYSLDGAGEPDYDHPLLPDEARLPVDPTTDVPDGYRPEQRGVPGGFMADPDIMDTWATSSLTPQIAGRWEDDPDLWARLWPMDLRPQGHDIIRTWLFTTVVRAHLEEGTLPWTDTALSGWILDPDRKKMSKSKGNVVTPMDLLVKHSSDAVRYWAASARLGVDTAFDEGQMKIGRKLAIKILNAAKFVLGTPGLGLATDEEALALAAAAVAAGQGTIPDVVTEAIDRALLASLRDLAAAATASFEAYDYARALEQTEAWFWQFCDDYVELVKSRAYGEVTPEGAASARVTLLLALSTLLRLFAPVLPFTTEEVWSWWQEQSIHRSSWPAPPAGAIDGEALDAPGVLAATFGLLRDIRRAKTDAGVSLRAPVASLTIRDRAERLPVDRAAEEDLRRAGWVDELVWVAADVDQPVVEVELSAPPAS